MNTQDPTRSRRLRDGLEPLIGAVYFSPECHDRYVDLGFDPSPGKRHGVAMPDGPAYFCSRGSALGQASGQLVAAAFGVFNPAAVVPMVELGWTRTDAPTIAAARHDGAVDQLRRVLGEPEQLGWVVEVLTRAVEPLPVASRPLFAGVSALPEPSETMGWFFRRGDQLREYRGDCHNISWTAAGLSAADIGLLTEQYWGLPPRSYVLTRAWSADDLDRSATRLTSEGWLDADGVVTDEGRRAREDLEATTDAQMTPAMDAIGADAGELFDLLDAWSTAMIEADAYPSGPGIVAGR